MGSEATCTARFNGRTTKGKVRLETDSLEFRAPELRLSIPFKQMKHVAARGGALAIESLHGDLSLTLGSAAEKWALKIQHPPSRLEKIGIKPQWRVSVFGVTDAPFLTELERSVEELSIGRPLRNSDAIFLGATKEADLARLATLKAALKPNGALWVIRPKKGTGLGRRRGTGLGGHSDRDPSPTERAVMAAGKAAGLVDVKVVSFSPTHTAEKFVIPVKDR